MGDSYVYIVHTAGPSADDQFPTRHDAVGEQAILESLGIACEIRTRKRLATDPVTVRN